MRLLPPSIVLFSFLFLPSLVHAEPIIRCTHREDRPDLGSPVHDREGGRKLRRRLPNGHHVRIIRGTDRWARIEYHDPGPPVRSEPLRFYGWISKRYLKTCPTIAVAPVAGDPLAELRAALHGVRSAPSDEHITVGPLEASMLVGMTRDEIVQALSEPGQCQVASQPAPCQSATEVFYSFYHLPEGSVGGGPELLLRFEGERCVTAEWRFTE